MKKKFSTKWKKSKQPRKQRKYRHNAPIHIKGKFLNVHLSKDLAKKHDRRNTRIKTGDKVKVLRGNFRGKEGKIEMIDIKKSKVVITGIEVSKKEGSKSKPFIPVSNVMIIELNLDDRKRLVKKGDKKDKKVVKAEKKKEVKEKVDNKTKKVEEKKKAVQNG